MFDGSRDPSTFGKNAQLSISMCDAGFLGVPVSRPTMRAPGVPEEGRFLHARTRGVEAEQSCVSRFAPVKSYTPSESTMVWPHVASAAQLASAHASESGSLRVVSR